MAYKQKSGSPFQRNFGIGKSPLEAKPTPKELVGSKPDLEATKEKYTPLEMASPMKRNDVYIDGENIGSGPEAIATGLAKEKEVNKARNTEFSSTGRLADGSIGGGLTEEEVLAQEAENAENERLSGVQVSYDKQDAIDRINMNSKGMVSGDVKSARRAILKSEREGGTSKYHPYGRGGNKGSVYDDDGNFLGGDGFED